MMKCFFYDFSFFVAVITVSLVLFIETKPDDVKRFIVVSDFTVARPLYDKIRGKAQATPDNITNVAARRKICADIFGTAIFVAREEYPAEKLRKLFRLKTPEDYNDKEVQVFRYRDQFFNEHGFVCKTRKNSEITQYFVSREYNLLAESEFHDVAARFIFHDSKFLKLTTLDYVAEERAKAFLSIDYTIEDIYLQRKAKLIPSESRKDDPLCKLRRKDKLRICVAVLNSAYFQKRIEYPVSHVGWIRGTCELETVFFQTAKPDASSKKFQEWMLSCQASETRFDYFLSHAYQSHEIFVYARHLGEQIFLENLSVNLRLTLDKNSFRHSSNNNTYDMSNDYLYIQT